MDQSVSRQATNSNRGHRLGSSTCHVATLQYQSGVLRSVPVVRQSRPVHLESVTLVQPVIRQDQHVVKIQNRHFRGGVVWKVVLEIESNNG